MEEQEYIRSLAEGDPKAFELLFLRYQPKLIFFLVGFLHEEEVARDMAQDIFIKVWNNRQKMPNVLSFSSYLFQMARNAVYNYYDHQLVQQKFEAFEAFKTESYSTTEEALFAAELQKQIEGCIEQMPPQRKRIFCMSRIEGLSNDEISELLDISKGTVENHITAALRDLRKAIQIALLICLFS